MIVKALITNVAALSAVQNTRHKSLIALLTILARHGIPAGNVTLHTM